MIRRPPRSTQSRSSAASDVYKRQSDEDIATLLFMNQSASGQANSQFGSDFQNRLTGGAAGIVSGRAGQALRRTLGSVSYTHLRAHETVLDLVCRLLLEKKKKKEKEEKKEEKTENV